MQKQIRRYNSESDENLLVDISPVLARVFNHRGIINAAELDYRLERLPPPDTLKGLSSALTLLVDAMQQQHNALLEMRHNYDQVFTKYNQAQQALDQNDLPVRS